MLAQIYMRQEKFDLARKLLEPVLSAKDRPMQSQAQSLLASIKSYEDRMAHFKSESNSQPGLQRQPEPTTGGETAEPEMTPADYLREALRPVEAGEERVQGLFIKLDCDKGTAYFLVQPVIVCTRYGQPL